MVSLSNTAATTVEYDPIYDPTAETMADHYRGFVSDRTYYWALDRRSLEAVWRDGDFEEVGQ